MTLQEKLKKKLIKTPIKKLNKHFNFTYIFTPPTEEERTYLERKVSNALQKKSAN